jgi:hypothetical protein
MHPYKEVVAKDILDIVQMTCGEVLCPKEVETNDPVNWALNLSADEASLILRKIVNALPDSFFMHGVPLLEDDLKQLVAKEYILFQSQENIKDERYPAFLVSFIYEIIDEINQKIFKGNGY